MCLALMNEWMGVDHSTGSLCLASEGEQTALLTTPSPQAEYRVELNGNNDTIDVQLRCLYTLPRYLGIQSLL